MRDKFLLEQLKKHGYINSSNDNIVALGLKRIGNVLIDIVMACFCAWFWGDILVGIFFEAGFYLLRVYAGGAHATTEKMCKYLTFGSTILSIILVFFLPAERYILHGIFIFSVVLVTVLAPVESCNKPLTEREKSVYYRRCLYILAFEIAIYVLSYNLGLVLYARAICYSLVVVTIGMLIGKLLNKRVDR